MGRTFAFGANMCGRVLARRGVTPLASEPACLADHRLVFDQGGIPLVEPAFASIVPAPGEVVWGVLHELSDEQLHRLDGYETAAYRREDVTVIGSRSGPSTARVYRTRHPVPERRPSARYLALLVEGAREHGLPEEYVSALAARPTAYVPVLSEVVGASVRSGEWLLRLFTWQRHRGRRAT